MTVHKIFEEYTTIREWLASKGSDSVPEAIREAAWDKIHKYQDLIADAPPIELAVIRMKLLVLAHIFADDIQGHVAAGRAFTSAIEGLEKLSAAGAEGAR